jgi:hypothetical protein
LAVPPHPCRCESVDRRDDRGVVVAALFSRDGAALKIVERVCSTMFVAL